MSEIAKIIDSIVTEGLTPCLKPLGFKKKGRDFYRVDEEPIAVINVQSSKWNSGADGQFTLNLGRYFPALAKLEGNAASKEIPKEYDCSLRARIGMLLPDNKDLWWDVSASTDSALLAKNVQNLTKTYALPWLDRVASINSLQNEIHGLPALTAASLCILIGNREEASRIASRFLKERPLATAHINARAVRNGVPIAV
jgi:hypothetical protein